MGNCHIIKNVLDNSIAKELGIKPGDMLLSVNNMPVEDIFDYRYLIADEYIEMEIKDSTQDICIYEIEKEYDEDPGLEFESDLMDDFRSCVNNCIFCFVDQMPPGMRETLYFKDDDSRLSFLQGNYVTLTNMKEEDTQRIIKYRMEPVNISVHTTNKELRVKMLKNKNAGEVLRYIDILNEANIKMNAQIVLCKNLNDGLELEKTLDDLMKYIPNMQSVSVVPAGLTKYREGLYPLEPFNENEAKAVIEIIEKYQKKIYNKHGIHFVHASDEFYLLAAKDVPEEERYDGYLQFENGVGMFRSMYNELIKSVDDLIIKYKSSDNPGFIIPEKRNISLGTGYLSGPLMEKLSDYITSEFIKNNIIKKDDWNIRVYKIRNDFFGEHITVSGLLTGGDIINQLKGKEIGDGLLLPVNMFRAGEKYFLDDVTKEDVEKALGVKINITPGSGEAFLNSVIGIENTSFGRQHYEQKDGGNSRKA